MRPRMWWLLARCARGRDDEPHAHDWAKRSLSRSRHHRYCWGRPVEGVPVFFDEGPEFINLRLCHLQPTDEMCAHSSCVLTGQVQAVEDRVRFTMLDPTDSPQAVAFDEHRHGIQQHVPICAQRLKECPSVSTKSMGTRGAVITTFNMAIGSDVVSTYFPKIWTQFLITPLSLSFHCASPRLGRCAKYNSKMDFPGLEVQHRDMGPATIMPCATFACPCPRTGHGTSHGTA